MAYAYRDLQGRGALVRSQLGGARRNVSLLFLFPADWRGLVGFGRRTEVRFGWVGPEDDASVRSIVGLVLSLRVGLSRGPFPMGWFPYGISLMSTAVGPMV
uniref:Uncharacterized protein n=1 Tax=Globodera pallida TaxID=36090 RepID=A0A183C3H2_GLOPA